MKRNEVGDFTILYIEPGDQRTDLFQIIALQKRPVILIPGDQAGILQRPDDFTLLKYVKRQVDLPIIFILPQGGQQAQLAARNGFPVYQSMDALLDALSIGQLARTRTVDPSNPSYRVETANKTNTPNATKPLPPRENNQRQTRPSVSNTSDTRRPDSMHDTQQQQHEHPNMPSTTPLARPVTALNRIDTAAAPQPGPASNRNGQAQQGSPRISVPLPLTPHSVIPEAQSLETPPDPQRTPAPETRGNRQYSTGTPWPTIDISNRNTGPLAPRNAPPAPQTPFLSQTAQEGSKPLSSPGKASTATLLLNNNSAANPAFSPPPSGETAEEDRWMLDQPLQSPPPQKTSVRTGPVTTPPLVPVGLNVAPTPSMAPVAVGTTPRQPMIPADFDFASPPSLTPLEADLTPAQSQQKKHVARTEQALPLRTIALICALIIIIAGSLLVIPHLVNGAVPTTQINGRLVFTSSGQVSETSNQGIEDQVTLDLTNISPPANNKVLYAWLLGDKNASDPRTIPLGKVQLNNGKAHIFYPGDAQHTNILSMMSRVLVTEEDTAFPPIAPSPDQNTWRYYSSFSTIPINAPDNTKHFSFLDHLRHLLAADPTLEELELPGGLNKWLYNNTSKVMEWVDSTRQQWEETKDSGFVRRQIERTLQFLDGNTFVYQDLPAGTALLVNERLARVGLINVTGPNQDPPDYLDHITKHLNGLLEAKPTPAVSQKITALITAMGNVNQWLKQVRHDAQQLMQMTDEQMMQPSTLSVIDDMIANMDNAYSGQPDPSTNTMREGVNWLHNQMQFLAILDITPWTTTNP